MWRAVLFVAFAAAMATPAAAKKPFDIHGLIVGTEGARYLKGVPTFDLQQQRGAVQLRSLGFYNNRPMFAIAFYNAGTEPVNIGLEDIRVDVNGAPLRIFPVEELQRQEKNKAAWSKFAIVMLGGVSAGLAASQRNTYRSSISGPYGTYTVHASYPSLAGQLQAQRISMDTAWSVAAIQYQLDRTIEMINDHVVQRTTVDPGSTYGGLIIMDKLKRGDPPFELRLSVDWNGERYPFGYLMLRPGKQIPQQYAGMLAVHSKPKPISARFGVPKEQVPGPAASIVDPASRSAQKGAILLQSGAIKIPAKTRSGYCLKTPYGYRGTGATETPVITGALPRCLDDSGRVAEQNDSPLRRN